MGIVFNFSRGGSLRTSLEYDQATADYDLSLLLSNLSLAGTAAYFNQVIDIGSVEGLVTLDLHVKGNANHLLDLRTYGIAAASGLKLRDSRNNRIIDVDTLNFDLRDGNLGTMQYDIRRIYAAGIRTQLYTEQKKFKAKMSYADKLGVPYVVFLGDDEIAGNVVACKDMTSGEQTTLPFEETLALIQTGLAKRNEGSVILEK